jgi:hypothetical protein
MIAFVQPFPLDGHGGGARILRSLLEEAPAPYVSVCTAPSVRTPLRDGVEVHVPRRPAFGRLDATRIHRQLDRLEAVLSGTFKERLARVFEAHGVKAVHAIPHGLDFWHAFEVAEQLGLPFVLNVHDDLSYNLAGVPYLPRALDRLGHVWRQAPARVVISEAMGQEYDRRYGTRPHVVVTDGLRSVAASARQPEGLRVYFMGSIHLSYEANFGVLFDALRRVKAETPTLPVSLTVRGGFPFPVRSDGVAVEVRPWGSQAEVEADMAEADVLYFPLPFEPRYAAFARFSLSTKLVSYLGSGVPILYHGPEDAAAGRLLARHDAAVLVTSPAAEDLANGLQAEPSAWSAAGTHALRLAADRFMLDAQRATFWNTLASESAAVRAVPAVLSDGAA